MKQLTKDYWKMIGYLVFFAGVFAVSLYLPYRDYVRINRATPVEAVIVKPPKLCNSKNNTIGLNILPGRKHASMRISQYDCINGTYDGISKLTVLYDAESGAAFSMVHSKAFPWLKMAIGFVMGGGVFGFVVYLAYLFVKDTREQAKAQEGIEDGPPPEPKVGHLGKKGRSGRR
jgi:hypothetical protein